MRLLGTFPRNVSASVRRRLGRSEIKRERGKTGLRRRRKRDDDWTRVDPRRSSRRRARRRGERASRKDGGLDGLRG